MFIFMVLMFRKVVDEVKLLNIKAEVDEVNLLNIKAVVDEVKLLIIKAVVDEVQQIQKQLHHHFQVADDFSKNN